jgi:GxxExxY protein
VVLSHAEQPPLITLMEMRIEMDEQLIHKDLSEVIIGAAMTVLNTLRPGLDEKLYERALVIELRKRGHKVDSQREYPVFYDGQHIGTLIPDLIVNDMVIADPKVVTAFNEAHFAQMIGYLSLTGLRLALLLNFKNARLEWERIVR